MPSNTDPPQTRDRPSPRRCASTPRPPRHNRRSGVALALAAAIASLASPAPAYPPIRLWTAQAATHTVFPHIRINRSTRTVELDASISINAHATDGSVVFLEVIACRPDTKEHESLVVTDALPSHLHAALLLLNLQPGHPGGWEWNGPTLVPLLPQGPPLTVSIAWIDDTGHRHQHPATDLVINRADSRTLTSALNTATHPSLDAPTHATDFAVFAFAGSRFVQRQGHEFYDADAAGLIVGLHTFGPETVALNHLFSPEASIEEPEWIARRDLLPPRGTHVTVIIHAP